MVVGSTAEGAPSTSAGLLQLFRSYEQLTTRQRGRLLKLFEAQLQGEFARKRWDH